VLAMCLMSTRSEEDRAEGRAILLAWQGYLDVEPELGIRLLLLLLYGFTHLLDKQPGREMEGRIRQFLGDRASFDPAAKDALYTLDRSSASLYQPDVAIVRKREAVAYYGPTPGNTVLRRPVEYYRCLVNYGASQISNGRYQDAIETYGKVQKLAKDYTPDTFPRLDFPQMNQLLAEYRCKRVSTTNAVRRQQEIVSSLGAISDPFYVENALAVYLALDEDFERSITMFDRLEERLTTSRINPEPSMIYLIAANRAATQFLVGDRSRARSEWAALTDVVNRIPYVFRPILIRRHELIAETFLGAGDESMDPREFDEHLIVGDRAEFGPLWQNFGRGFRMPEVEIWREN
jgi:tetratricopeptide (TPR) repeat protein